MRIEHCITEVDLTSTAPFQRNAAEIDWIESRDAGVVPAPLFALYESAGYLSFGSAPASLSEPTNKVFGYFCLIVRSLKGVLEDAHETLLEFKDATRKTYDYGKQYRGEEWDPAASRRANREFRTFVLLLCSGLDLVAELTALILNSEVPELAVGRSHFKSIEKWLKVADGALPLIYMPKKAKAEELRDRLRPLVLSTGSDRDWLPLLNLLRNKAAHYGIDHFRQFGFHDEIGIFYHFFPRRWPVLWEEYMRPAFGSDDSKLEMSSITDQLMKEDVLAFVDGLHAKVFSVISESVSILQSAFVQFRDFEFENDVLRQLEINSKQFSFESFSAKP